MVVSDSTAGARWRQMALWGVLSFVACAQGDDEPLIGWKGAVFEPSEVFKKNQQPVVAQENKKSWIEHISWRPRAFLYHNFATDEEANHLIKLARPKMWRSTVEGDAHGNGNLVNDVRTSYGTFLRRMSDPIITSFEEKLAMWTHLNVSHQEDIQILRYAKGQKYSEHWDTLMEGSPRVCTVLVYLADVEEGGETAFPGKEAQWVDPQRGKQLGPFSKCAEGHVAVKPKKGDALLFYTFNPTGTQDDASLHTGCPVVKGVKWTATIWIHSIPFRPEELVTAAQPHPEDGYDPAECTDLGSSCKDWASSGECERNPAYMKGRYGGMGYCRLTCKACTPCEPHDRQCRENNRAAAGYLPLDEDEM